MSYTVLKGDTLECTLCPNHCRLKEGEFGICRVRVNRGGKLELPYYGVLSAISVDPIEKKPLYHFQPGSSILSVGFYGCSFHCPFCQNYRIAHYTPPEGSMPRTEPADIVAKALAGSSRSIAYTYSEPTVHFEWIVETARLAREAGVKNVLVSNGYLNPKPAAELIGLMDAANIDLKSSREDFYKNIIGGHIAPVKAFLREAARRIHLEVTTLVIPGYNDSEEEILEIAAFLADLDPNIPLHLSCYYPAYRFTAPPTPPETVFHLAKAAGKILNYVYPGNVGLSEITTSCPACGHILIRRRGYWIDLSGIRDGKCAKCGRPVDFPL